MKRTFSISGYLVSSHPRSLGLRCSGCDQAPAPVTQAPASGRSCSYDRSSDRRPGCHARRGSRGYAGCSATRRLHADGRHAR